MADNPLWEICERVAELQALLGDPPLPAASTHCRNKILAPNSASRDD
jgi:hypothetical protein